MACRRIAFNLLALVVLVANLLPNPGVAQAQTTCSFKLGFLALHNQIPAIVGNCLENERFNPANGNAEQRSQGGLLVWRKADNWTAFTNGSVTWINGPNGLQSRANNQRFSWEQPSPATGVVPPPPVVAPAVVPPPPVVAPAVVPPPPAGATVMLAPPDDIKFYCLTINPSCARAGPWWAEWMEKQDRRDLVLFAFAPGLQADYRLTEAIWMLWQWPVGKQILRRVGQAGYTLIINNFGPTLAFGMHNRATRTIQVNARFSETSTWMLADVLIHELQHGSDNIDGLLGQPGASCYQAEYRAFLRERDYLRWTVSRFGSPPTAAQLQGVLSPEDLALYYDLASTYNKSDQEIAQTVLNAYRQECSPS